MGETRNACKIGKSGKGIIGQHYADSYEGWSWWLVMDENGSGLHPLAGFSINIMESSDSTTCWTCNSDEGGKKCRRILMENRLLKVVVRGLNFMAHPVYDICTYNFLKSSHWENWEGYEGDSSLILRKVGGVNLSSLKMAQNCIHL
jgi:hypothetical protein